MSERSFQGKMEGLSDEDIIHLITTDGTPVNFPLQPDLQVSSASSCRELAKQAVSPGTPQTGEQKLSTKKKARSVSSNSEICKKVQSTLAFCKSPNDECRITLVGRTKTVRKLNLEEPIPDNTHKNSRQCGDCTSSKKAITSAHLLPECDMIQPQKQTLSGTNIGSVVSSTRPNFTPHLEALGTMTFCKAFMVLSNFPFGEWEKVFEVTEFPVLNSLSLEQLEIELQIRAAKHYKEDLMPHKAKINWEKLDDDHHLAFKATVNRNGDCIFQVPSVERGRTPLLHAFGDENILQVHFDDLKNNLAAEGIFKKKGCEGILVGLRYYEFFAYKDPKVKKKQGFMKDSSKDSPSAAVKCFFVCTKSFAKADHCDPKFREFKNIEEARHVMMHISTVTQLPKYISRLQLALSKTIRLDLDFSNVIVEEIDDIVCQDQYGNTVLDENSKPLIHTDGTGFISTNLARLCPCNIFKGGKQNNIEEKQEYPLLMQVRLFYKGNVYKGTLLVNNQLPNNTILCRPSMKKVVAAQEGSSSCFNSLEICNTSRKPMDARLFQHLILLLRLGDVPEAVFLQFLEEALEDIMTCFRNRSAAHRAISRSGDFLETCEIALRMVFSVSMTDAYLQKILWDLSKVRLQELKKARIPIRDTYNLMGCADPTGILERNQVAIILGDGPIYASKVLVYKPPGLHPGDIHVFEATWCQELEQVVGSAKYGIFFSVKGSRAVVDEMANSDLDGDMYWVCKNAELLKHYIPSKVWQKPWKQIPLVPNTPKNLEQRQEQHFQSFCDSRFRPSAIMGQAANNWLAHMDKHFTSPDMPDIVYHRETALSLVNLYYDAVDADKSGERVILKNDLKAKEWPHYMEKEEGKYFQEYTVYNSSSILGKIYDRVTKTLAGDDICFPSPNESIALDPVLEYPGYKAHLKAWTLHFRNYRNRVQMVMKRFPDEDSRSAHINKILQEYRQMLYRADSMKDSPRSKDELYQEASAIYTVVYTEANCKLARQQDFRKPSEVSARQGMTNETISKPGLQFVWRVAGVALCRLYAEKDADEPLVLAKRAWQEININRKQQKISKDDHVENE